MRSIRRQLMLALLCLFAVLQGAGLLALFVVARDGTIEEFDDALLSKALAVSKLVVETPAGLRTDLAALYIGAGDNAQAGGDNPEPFGRFLNEFRRHGRHNYFELWDAAGKPLAKSERLLAKDLPRPLTGAAEPLIWNFSVNDEAARAIEFTFHPGFAEGSASHAGIGPVQLVVAAEREALDDKLMRLELLTMACGIVLLGATLWVMPGVLKRGLSPLNRLGEDVARVDATSLKARFSRSDAPKELHPIVDGLNGFMARLQQSFERERCFSADLAHELRTPLSELRGLAECALKWPETRGSSLDRDILAIARQMESLVERMLALARGEHGLLAPQLETLELSGLMDEIWRHFAPRAEKRELRMILQLAPTFVVADPSLMRSVLGVVFENAVNYTPRGGAITAEIMVEGSRCIIRITNETTDLEPADMGKLFDRFWRKEMARSGGLHLGLGLSLARTHAITMGWSIDAALDDRRRLRMTIAGPTGENCVADAASNRLVLGSER